MKSHHFCHVLEVLVDQGFIKGMLGCEPFFPDYGEASVCCLFCCFWWLSPRIRGSDCPRKNTDVEEAVPPSNGALGGRTGRGKAQQPSVPEDVRESLGIRKATSITSPSPRSQSGHGPVMPGSTALDPAHDSRASLVCTCRVVEIGKIDDPQSLPETSAPAPRLAGGRPGKEGKFAGSAL